MGRSNKILTFGKSIENGYQLSDLDITKITLKIASNIRPYLQYFIWIYGKLAIINDLK